MKKVFACLAIAGFVVAVIAGTIHWNNQISHVTKAVDQTEKGKEEKQASAGKELPSYFPAAAAEQLKNNKKLSLVIVGDEATSTDPEGWPAKLQNQLRKAYGENVWNVTVKQWKGETTEKLLKNKRISEITSLKPDILLLEVPLLTDNVQTGNGKSILHTQKILNEVKTELPNCTIILQPPNPVYKGQYYPKAVEALKQFAEQNKYAYIDHWSAWPGTTSTDILQYLQKPVGFPNTKGQDIWAGAVSKYFIGE
jgi:hypothetical protein